MPWQSRIESEHVRRAVVAAIMAVVLGLALLGAVGLSASRSGGIGLSAFSRDYDVRRSTVAMADDRFGPYSFRRPAAWQRRQPPNDADDNVLVLVEPSGPGRLVMSRWVYRVPADLDTAFGDALRQYFSSSLVVLGIKPMQNGPMRIKVGQILTDRSEPHFVAVFSIDGQRYLGLDLHPPAEVNAATLINDIVESVQLQ